MSSELHNELINKFVHEIIGPMLRSNKTHAEFMVLMESINLGALQVLSGVYQFTSRDAGIMLDSMIERVIERHIECDMTK